MTPEQVEAAGDAAEAADDDDPEVAAAVEAAAADAVPKPKAQRNFTDPDSKIMKTSDRSFHQCYNAQAILGRLPGQLLADAGYFSDDNVTHCTGLGVDALFATGRFKHNEPAPPAPRGPIPNGASVK